MLRPLRTLLLAGVATAILAACGGPVAPAFSPSQAGSLSSRADQAPKDKEAFLAVLKDRGIRLSASQLADLTAERHLTPSGDFADRPAANLSAEANLTVHFKKHRHEFKPALRSEADYVAKGVAAATGDRGKVRFYFDTTSFEKGYQSHIVRWVPKTKDFCAFRPDGAMTTYYLNFKLSSKRFIEVPPLR